MRKVVYTVLTGDYDRLLQPEIISEQWDYICFTDRDGEDGVWKLRKIDFDSSDNTLRARYTKLLPHTALAEYDYSLFMDANLCITGEELYEKADEAIASGVLFAALEHPLRDCVWEELKECYLREMIDTPRAIRHRRYLKEKNVPRHFGLYETNVLLRAHNNPDVKALDTSWWEALRGCCNRDQLTLTPLLEEKLPLLLGPGKCARNVPYIRYSPHRGGGSGRIPGKISLGNLLYHVRRAFRKIVIAICLR